MAATSSSEHYLFLQDSILNSVPENAYGCTFYMPNDHTFKIMQSMALHSEENDKETKLVRKVWKRMEEDKGFARCLLMYHLVPGKKDKFKNNKTRETGKYQYDTSVQPAVNGGRPVQIQVDYKKGEKAKISTFLDKVEVIGEDKFADANPKPTCMIHVINGIILPYDPGGGQNISIQLCFHLKWRMFFLLFARQDRQPDLRAKGQVSPSDSSPRSLQGRGAPGSAAAAARGRSRRHNEGGPGKLPDRAGARFAGYNLLPSNQGIKKI